MTIHPAFSALDWLSNTPATTPLPSRIRIAVPITSAPKMLKSLSSLSVVELAAARGAYSCDSAHVNAGWKSPTLGEKSDSPFAVESGGRDLEQQL